MPHKITILHLFPCNALNFGLKSKNSSIEKLSFGKKSFANWKFIKMIINQIWGTIPFTVFPHLFDCHTLKLKSVEIPLISLLWLFTLTTVQRSHDFHMSRSGDLVRHLLRVNELTLLKQKVKNVAHFNCFYLLVRFEFGCLVYLDLLSLSLSLSCTFWKSFESNICYLNYFCFFHSSDQVYSDG